MGLEGITVSVSFAAALAFRGIFLFLFLCFLASIRVAIYKWCPDCWLKRVLLIDLRGKRKPGYSAKWNGFCLRCDEKVAQAVSRLLGRNKRPLVRRVKDH